MVPRPKKALKMGGKALRTVTRLPARVSGGRGSGRNNFQPIPGENPIVLFRLQVEGCKDLLAKDKNGFSDPFVVVSVLSTRFQTPVSKKTLNPSFAPTDATFDFPIYLSLADKLGVVELVIWDKDVLKKEYLGEASLPLDDWFREDGVFAFDDPNNKAYSVSVVSTRPGTNSTGTVQVKVGFVPSPNTQALMDFSEIYEELVRRSRPSLVSAPPTEGIGTLRSHQTGPEFEDDGGISSDEGENDSDDEREDDNLPPLAQLYIPPTASPSIEPVKIEQPQPQRPELQSQVTPTTPTLGSSVKTPITAKPGSPAINISKILRRPTPSRSASYDLNGTSTVPSGASTPAAPPMHQRTTSSGQPIKNKFRRSWSSQPKKKDYNFSTENDIQGIVMLEIQNAVDLPRLKNMTRTGWDMDPFVVISFGKKVFRTRVIRHSRNPVWDEKLLFHVREYETSFKVQLTVLDWDKLSSNDYVGETSFMASELLADAPQRDPVTGLYDEDADGKHPMKEFQLPLSTAKEMPWEAKHNPIITFKAKYQPYDALRQRFWRQYLKQYDTDDTGSLSHLELTSMLDSLGSTLSAETVNSFFTRNGKKAPEDELSIPEAVQCLETELGRPTNEKRRVASDDNLLDYSSPPTPTMTRSLSSQQAPQLGKLDFSGPPMVSRDPETSPVEDRIPAQPAYPTEYSQQPLSDAAAGGTKTLGSSHPGRIGHTNSSTSAASSDAEDSSGSGSEDSVERVINVKNCPLCHRPRLNKKAEMDIVTHLAVCASGDWAKIDRIVVGNFVTASQAQRKWYTKIITKVSSGDYKLGANSANIIVQNRMTGQLEEEKMQVYVRLGIRLLYKGAKSRMEGARARRLLKSMSIKQGVKYDDPASARDIPTFIEFHRLNVHEILDPIESFKTFNEFFYRKLKPSARPLESPDDPRRIVSGADCRMMAFETVNEATRLWIKGREFTVSRLLGDVYKDEADKYLGGAVAIFRLAPQDYHRFHSPVDGTIGKMTYISGEYYTVNPQAIRTALDVYGENARKIVPIDSPVFGRVMAVCVGAMMVGSIQTTVEEGEEVKRGQEFGYFAFGGSTIVLLFEKGMVEWDEDLLINGRASLETLVRVGMGVGRSRRSASHSPS